MAKIGKVTMNEDLVFWGMTSFTILNFSWGWYIYRRIEKAIDRANKRLKKIESKHQEFKNALDKLKIMNIEES